MPHKWGAFRCWSKCFVSCWWCHCLQRQWASAERGVHPAAISKRAARVLRTDPQACGLQEDQGKIIFGVNLYKLTVTRNLLLSLIYKVMHVLYLHCRRGLEVIATAVWVTWRETSCCSSKTLRPSTWRDHWWDFLYTLESLEKWCILLPIGPAVATSRMATICFSFALKC